MTTRLHQVHIHNYGKEEVGVRVMQCMHCHKQLGNGDAFAVSDVDPLHNSDGYKDRAEYETCTKTANRI